MKKITITLYEPEVTTFIKIMDDAHSEALATISQREKNPIMDWRYNQHVLKEAREVESLWESIVAQMISRFSHPEA